MVPVDVADLGEALAGPAGRELRAYGGTCPHRGATLALGGRLQRNAVICPFHVYSITLAYGRPSALCVPEYAVCVVGGIVFVRMSPEHDNGWTAHLAQLAGDHHFVTGFELTVRTAKEAVIENAFDQRHFHAVHGIRTGDFIVETSKEGALTVESAFRVPGPPSSSCWPVQRPWGGSTVAQQP